MFDERDRKYFYDEFKNNGYEVGSYDDFKKDLNNKEDRDWYYNEAKNMGYDVGTQADFDKMVLEPAPSTSGGGKQVDASATTQSVEQKASTETKPQVAQPAKKQETIDKEPGLIAKVLDMIPTGVQTSNGTYQPSPEIPQPVVKGEEMPVKEEASSSSSANTAPVTTPTGVVNNEGLMDAKLANYIENWKQRPDKEGDYFANMVADLLADGTANSNEEAVNMVMPALYRYANRSAMDVTNQVVSSLPDDTVQDAEQSIDAQWYSHGVQDKLNQEADSMGISYDDYVTHFLKPAMVQSLVNKYGPNYRNIAEGIATRLYAHDEHVQDRLMNQDINDALSSVINKYVNPSVVDEYNKAQEAGSKAFSEGMEGSQFIPANLRLGTALGAQYEANEAKDPAKVLSGLQQKFGKLYRNPKFLNDMSNAAFKVMQRYGLNGTLNGDPKQFKPMINSVLKNELDQLEIKGMMPKGSAEYIMKTGLGNTIVGKITRKAVQTDYQNWLEDIANQQYQPGFWENVASGALTFAGDAWSYWLPGAAGGKLTKSMIAKAEGRLAGDLMAKGMERRVAERAAKVLIGKSKAETLKSGAVHGAVTFGGQSAISKPIDEVYRTGQFDENGKIYNPSVGKVIANTLGEVAKQTAVGAIMQGGTIANMVGKGRGLATNILADVGGKVVDSGIMTGQQLLERMAHDPNFKPTGKEAVETFLESGANLLSIGFPGFVGKYARFKDAKEFNKKFDFTDQDIAELKRFGYDGLRDAFEKVGIGEYTVVGENAQRLDGQLTQKYMDLMNDKSVPEVLKAKMMAVVEGKRPSSFSPVVDSVIVQPMDNGGKVYLETLNKDGGIIDRKEFSSLDEAQKADKKLEYEKTLGLASVLEGEFHNEFTQEHLEGLYNKAAQKYNMGEKLTDEDKTAVYLHQNAGAIKEIMDKQQKGIILTDEEQKQVNAYRHYYDSALENSSVMREFVNTFEDSHGVARGTLRKALESKDKKYAPLVESYLKELYNSIELKREMKQTMDDLYNTSHGNEQKRIEGENPVSPVEGSAGGQEPPVSEGPASYQDRTKSVPTPSDAEVAANPANVSNSSAEGASPETKVAGSDAFVMGQNAYKNGDSEALQAIDYNSDLATGRLKRAFADNEKMPDIVANAYNEGRDMEQFVAQRASSLTPAQKEAISKYVEAMDAKKGAIDALQHADDGYGEALKEQLWPYQTEDGNIMPATLDSGKQVFLKKANEYGGAFVVVPDEQGQPTIKQVSNAEIREVGTPVPLDEYIESSLAQQKDARNKQFISQFDGSGLKPNDQVTVAMEEGDANINMTFAGYSEDGKIVLTDGKDYLPLSKEEFAAWRKNALDNTINEHLDREDGEREIAELKQAEADKKERFAKGIVGLSEGHPDYSSKDTDAKVAAEYLQEQYGEDHGKLLNLVNGSRDDIKTQLANKRKAAAEYQNWLDTNADLDPEKAKKVEDELSLVNEQIADLDARFKNWNTIRNSVMTPDEVKAMTEERKAEVEKAGVDETAIVPSDDFHVLVLDDKELKKQYPTMDEATDYITSQRKDIYHTQEDVERKINGVNDMLDQYINGETELEPNQLMELNTTKAQLEALQTNLSVAAKGLKAQANKLSKLYKTEVSQQEMEELGMMTPSEQRKVLVSDAIKKNDLGAIIKIYKDASVDVTDFTPQTLEEAVSEYLRPHSLNPESLQDELGKSNFKFGIGKGYDSNKFNYLIAKKGTGMSVNEFAVKVYNDLPVNLQDMGYTDQDVRNTLLDMFKSYDSVNEMKNVALMNRIAAAEDELASEEEYYEAQKEREIIERQAEIEKYKSYIHEKELSLPSESELDHINGLEFDRMMEIEDREREYKQYVKSILPELADYDDRSNEEGYGGGSSLGSDSSRRGVDEGNSQGEEVGNGEASSESEIGEGSDSGRKGRQETGSMEPGEGSAVRGSHLPQEASFGERLKSAIAETETEPTEAQKKAGNYKKGHLSFGGYDYTVETPKGVTRSGKDEQGKPWSVTMHDTYGYILGKIGVDGDHIDMFINDSADLDTFDGNVYVVDQVNPETGEFDEHKVMYGYPSEEAATEAYLANYSKGWKGLGNVTSVPKATFDKWLESSDRKTKPFADYAMVQKEQRAAYEEEMMQDGAHSEAFDKIVDLAKEQKEYWDLMEQGEVDPNEVPEVDVAHEMDKLLETLSDEEFKEVSDVLWNMDEEFEYWTANEHERREDLAERKNAAAYSEFLKQETKSIAPFADALRNAVNGGDKKAIAKAQKELTDALLASNLGHGYLSGQLEYAKSAKKKDESYSERRAFIKPLTDAINAIESALDSALADVGLEGVHVDFKEYGYGWIYADKGSDWRDRLEPLDNDYRNVSQYSDVNPISVLPQITMNNVKKVAGIIKSRIEEGERYNSDENQDENIEEAKKAKDNLPFHRDVKEVEPSEMTEAQKVAYDAVSTMLKKAGIPVKVVSNEDMEKVAEAQDNLNLAMLLNQPEMRFKIKTPEEKKAAENAYNFAKELRPDKWKQYAVVDMSNPTKMPEYFEKQELARKERSYYNKLMWGNYKVFNLDKSFEDNVAGLTGSFPSEFDPYKIDEQTRKKNELKKQIKETEDAYNSTGQERNNYQIQLMKEYMDEHGLDSENDIPDDVWNDCRNKSFEKYQDKLDSLFAKYKDLDRQLKAIAEPGVQYLKGKGVVYGYTDGKEIVLNQEHLNPNTPIHEYQHLWRTAAKEMNPELIEHGDKLIMQTQLFADLKQDPNYNHLTDEQICDEAFARLTGEDGAAILEQMAKDAIKENPLDTAKELSVINKLKEWLKKFWYWTLDTFTKWKPEDIKKMTLEDIRNLVLRDLANGVDPRTVMNEKKEGVKLSNKEKNDATERIDKRIAELNRQEKEQSLKSENGNLAESHDNGYLPSKDNLDGVQSVAPSSAKIDKKFPTKTFYLGNLANFITSMGKNADITAGNFTKKLFEGMGMTPHGKDTQVSEYFKYQTDDGGKTTVRLSDHSGNALSIIKKGGRADKGYSIVVRVDSSPKTKFKANKYSNVAEYVYENPNADGLKDIARSVFNLIDTGEYLDLAGANEVHVSPRNNNSETAKGNGGNLSVEDKIKAVSRQFGVDEADVAMYANAVKKGSTAEAARARANIKRHLLQANEDKISSLKELLKYTKPVNEALKENFGDVDAMIEERVKQVEAQRNAMEAARKRAEEEEAKRQKHLEELSVIPDDQLDKQYMDALAKGDDATAREMLDEAARRKGYDDTESAYQGVGAWAAPGNPGYESDKARRDDWESSGSDVNLEDMALGYTPQPDDYFSHPERYSQNTPHGLESVKAINTAIDAIKNGEKDVKVKVYRAVPTSVKEGKLRNGDWVTPSKKYADMHGANRLEGKYRIIEDEVPANQLWWDGNDANEFGFDDGKAYKYKNAKNNRKLNDLVTYDDKGDVIPPSKRFNSRKRDVRFMFAGEKGAAEVDKAEEKTYRMDNLNVAKVMEEHALKPIAIKYATGWERGADGKWRYEMPDFKADKPITVDADIDILHEGSYYPYKEPLCKLSDLIDDKNLFAAYPSLKNIYILLVGDAGFEGMYDELHNNIALRTNAVSIDSKYSQPSNAKEIEAALEKFNNFWDSLTGEDKELADDAIDTYGGYTEEELKEDGYFSELEKENPKVAELVRLGNSIPSKKDVRFEGTQVALNHKGKSVLAHEIQHAIQCIEGFAKGGSPEQMEKEFKEAQDEWKARAYAHELEEKAKEMGGEYNQSEVEKALVEEYKDLDMSDELPDKETRIKGFNYFARGYADRSMDDAIKRFRLNESTRSDFDSYKEYLKLAGEVESRNVQNRLGMTDEERRNSLASETEDVNRDEQIVMNGNDASYSIVKDPETIKKLDKEDTVKVYRAMQVGEDGKLYPPMAAKVKGKFVEPIELGKWEQADERPELADDKGMFTLNKGNGKSLKAAYNPYLHTSRTPLNDQFSEAQNRPNIVTVEVEVPKSELNSGYKADKAKDAVGEVEWKAGIIQGQLTGKRKVVLSRWDKPVRIVPDSEVADVIVNDMFKGKNITMPSNVVTPSLRKELEKRGVPFVETDNRGRIVGGENDGVHYSKVYGKNAQSPIVEQKLKKHPDSLMKAGTYFSGGGLVEEGLKGIIDPVVAVEYDRKISGVYRNNFGQHIVTADVRDVDPKELVKHIDGEVEYFHASPVCKNYSQAKSNGGEVELDKETAKSTADFIDAVKPRVVTIENVKGYKDSEAMKIITQALDKNGYTWDADVYNAADFGGYTNRERLIVRAVKDGELPEKPKKQPRKGGWLEAVEDILPTLTVKESGVAPWMDARLKADGIDWQKVEKPLYVMGSAYADGKIPHAYGDEILPTLRTKSGDVIIMPGGKVLRADGRVLARITGLGDDYLLPKTESLAHTIIGNGIPVQLTQGVIAPLLNKDDLSGRNVLARLGKSIFKNDWDADKQKKVSDQVVNTANKLGGAEATVYTSVDEVPDAYLSEVKNGATGWYDPETHTVHVYLPNCADANEAERTVFHEKIGHEGMEVLLGGEDEVRKFANFVYNSVAASTRGKILEIANEYDPDWKNPDRMNVGTQEYIARLAEEGPKTAEDFSLWTKIKHYLIKVLKKLGIRVPGLLNDKDLRYYLMKAGKALHVWDEMPQEKQETMMKQASNAEIKDSLSDGAGKGKPRQKKGESAIQFIKRAREWKRWKEAREDENYPEPPMFYDFDKDAEGKKEWERLNKEWRDNHHLQGDEMPIKPERKEGETDEEFFPRYKEWEKWNDAMADQEDPMPDMFAYEKKKQEEVKRKYEDWLAKHDLLEQQQADLDLYEGKIYQTETNPEADALEQRVMQDLAEVTSTDVSKEGAAKTVKHAVIHRRKNMEEASADDAIYINDVKNRIEKMADSGAFDKLLSDYKGKPNRAEKLAEAIPYIIEAPRRLRDLANDLNATGAFDKGHIHIQPTDVEAIQPFVADLIAQTGKRHTELKDGKEVEVYDDPQAVGEVASKMAQTINANHQGKEGFVPIDGSDILSEHVLPLVKQQIVPKGIDYKNLSPEMKSAIDSIRDWYNYTYDWLMDNHTLKAGTGYNVDYVNHIWDKEKSDKRSYAMYVENRQRTKSPNEKPRTISTLMEGISVGLVPKTTDITKMMAYYSRSNIEAWVNKTMLQELSGLNVIERNEDGEIVSSDPLLSSTPPFNLEQYKYFEIPGLGPVWVYKGNAKDYIIPNIITGKKILLYRQKSAAKRFGVVFEQYESSPFWETVDTLASSAKKLELGFSGFHAGALTEVYMVQNMVEFGPKKAMANFMKYIFVDTAKNHELPCFANPEDFQEAASHLVKFGATNDYAAADVQNMFDNMRDVMIKVQKKLKDGNKISGTVALATMPLKVATQMLSLINKGMDRALWDFLHDGLKLATYRMRADKTKERAKEKGWTEEELNRALDEDGQFVNDMFGGQHWDVLGASHRTLRYAGRVLLSPDWNASTTRHFLALTGYGSIWNEATFENFKQYYKRLKHKELIPEDEGRRSRQISALLCYGIGFMVFYEGIANGINAAFRALDEEKERKKAEEIRKTNPSYKSMYELAYPDGMKWYDYLMRGNSLGQQSKIFLGRYEDGTEMYIRHGKQFREVPEYLFNHKGELEFPGPMVQRMIGKANPMVRMTLDDINYLSDFQASHADQEIQRKYGKAIGLLYKDALYWAPFLIPSQENKEFKAVDFFFPSSKGFSPWKAQSYFKDFILSGDMEGVVMTYQSCQRNGIDAEAQIKAAIGSVKALESAEMQDGVTSLQEASKRFDAAKSITEKKKMRQKMKKFLSQSDYKAFTQKEALDMVQGYLNGDEDLKEMEKAESKYLMKAKAEDVTEDWRIQNVWNGTMETYQEYQRLKDVDKAKANAFKNSKTNKRLFAARKAISAARRKMNKAKKQMDGTNDAAKLVEIRNTRKELLEKLNGME